MSAERTQAIVLRRTNFGEADRILTLLTPLGQRGAMARSVRREKSKLAGGIELFGVSDVVLQQGKGDLATLTSARLIHFYRNIMADYDRLQFGYEAVKYVERASRDVDEPEWFDVVQSVFAGLAALSVQLQLTQVWFYIHYASLTGYDLSFSRDITGAPLNPERTYMYDISERGLRPSVQGDISADHIKFLRLVANKPLATVAQIGSVERILPDCWLLARQHAGV